MSWASERAIRVGVESSTSSAALFHQLSIFLCENPRLNYALVTPSPASVLIETDDCANDLWDDVERCLDQVSELGTLCSESHSTKSQKLAQEIVIPVCYDPSLGMDIDTVASSANCSIEDVVELHAGRAYQVISFGFLPGFAYCGSTHVQLQLSRLARPRLRVPGGSVAIAEDMTAIYPHQCSGGWHVIGRTPLRMFHPGRGQPCLLGLNDRVRFEPIDLETYRRLESETACADE